MNVEVDYELSDVRMIHMMANCSNEPTPRSLTVGITDYYVQHYVFPVQFILGVVGNSINLIVLLSSSMKNQANTLLSAMAFADLGFLFCMLPHSLVSFEFFYTSVRLSYIYFLTKTHAVGLANMFSTAATFLVLAVSLERFSGVRRPIHTRFQLRDMRIIGFILNVFALSFALSFYHHVEYNVNITIGCSNVWATFQHISQIPSTSKMFVSYVWHAKYIQSVFGVALPVIIVTILNVSLIYILRKREIVPRSVADKAQQNEFRYSDLGVLQRQERKVTATVIAIITCFTVTHLPTLIPFIWAQIYNYRGMMPTIAFNNVSTLLNMLLVSGKVLNFMLFCSSSAHFRRRTVTIFSAYLCHKRYRKKYSSMLMSAPPAGMVTTKQSNAFLNGSSISSTDCLRTNSVAGCTSSLNAHDWVLSSMLPNGCTANKINMDSSNRNKTVAANTLRCYSTPLILKSQATTTTSGLQLAASSQNLSTINDNYDNSEILTVVRQSNTFPSDVIINTINTAELVNSTLMRMLFKRRYKFSSQTQGKTVCNNNNNNYTNNNKFQLPLYQFRRYEIRRSSATLRVVASSTPAPAATLPLLAITTKQAFIN